MPTDARPLLYLKPPDAEDLLSPALGAHGWKVHVAHHADEALDHMVKRDFHVGLVHVEGGGREQAQREIERLHQAGNPINWVALLAGAKAPLNGLSRLITKYFYDYHTLPLDKDRLLVTLGHAHGMAEIASCDQRSFAECHIRHQMVGRSQIMQRLFRRIHKVAAIDLTVLIRGESGTGKELTAQAVHRLSSRGCGPFLAVNCGALPKDLIQTELFGHEKGAFTGADRRRSGRIEAAHGGTIFLDEIGDLPLDLQVNLLRFLQEKTIERVGGTESLPVDVRVIAATNVNLEQAVEEGRFREDLYYRLNVLHLEVPPLRQRAEDIPVLAEHFFSELSRRIPNGPKGFEQQAVEAMNAYPWPGNVRELVNRIQRAVVMCDGRMIRSADLGLDGSAPNMTLMTLAEARAAAEKAAIENTLRAMRNNVSKAARRLNISRVTLYRLMDAHDIDWQRVRED